MGAQGIWYDFHEQISVPAGQQSGTITLPLDQGFWSSPHGPFDSYRKDQLHTLKCTSSIPIHSLSIAFVPKATSKASWALLPLSQSPIPIGSWFEWEFRIMGGPPSNPVAIRLANGQLIPAFTRSKQKPLNPIGPSVFVIRLRPDEISNEQFDVLIQDGTDTRNSIWSAKFTFSPLQESASITAIPSGEVTSKWEIQRIPASTGWSLRLLDTRQTYANSTLPAAIAPLLRWNADWTEFRGPWVSNPLLCEQLDRILINEHVEAIDLLPQFIGENRSQFRFSLSPWHKEQGGSWQHLQDIAKDQRQHDPLLDHIREVIARARAIPNLKHWQIGLQVASDNSTQFQKGFRQITQGVKQMVRLYDGRPLILMHPEAVPFGRSAVSKTLGKSPLGEFIPYLGQGTTWKYTYATDQSLWDIHSQRLTIHRSGLSNIPVGFSLYAWMIDEYHRYYQQRLGYMDADTFHQVAYVDWDQSTAWEPVGHQMAWHPQYKRRVRKIGLQIIADNRLSDPKSLTFTLDNVIDQIAPPQQLNPLVITEKQDPVSQVAVWNKFEYQFELNHGVDNPYDSQQANVFAEIKTHAET